ncbi:MAG: butyryl-CoA dehydrogenase [candidate division Zixibacteria bacterium CG_4_9_14_3_um_filter_46_8]|nr:MAG: butyryl-CoA dehydrogenase [candidate division Zixibacteria bacterium CG_4_9_14_3_um_filter_46_8]
MDFQLNDIHQEIIDLSRQFAEKMVLPKIKEADRDASFDRSILDDMAEAGLLGLCFPEKFGGGGLDYISLGLACEELEYVDTSARVILSVHIGLAALPIFTWGNAEQKEKYLPLMMSGKMIGAFGLTEPNAGSDVVGIQTTAERTKDGYILNGEKMWISLSDAADLFLIFAWTDREKKLARDHSGITAFIVERSFGGIMTGDIKGKLGVRAGKTGFISMSDTPVPEESVLGQVGDGFKIAMFCLDQGRYTVAAGSTGLIRACHDACVKYANTRMTFAEPIGHHQLVKEMIAKMYAGYEICRNLYLKAGWMKNKGIANTRATSLAKWIACEQAEAAAADAVQVHGAYGFSDEYPVERYYRNAKGASIYEGTREIQKLIQSDYSLGYRADRDGRNELPTWPFEE